MKISEYLEMIGRKSSPTKSERKLFGIPDVKRGWLSKYGDMEISADQVDVAVGMDNARKFRQEQSKTKTVKVVRRTKKVSAKRANSDAFLLSYEWRQLRMKALKRDGAKCACCGATPQTGAVMNVDHIKPRKLHPELALDLNNLQVLCHECNHGKGNWDQTDWRIKE
jgi:5-methylcytosine-specific restriction endonuclease McrA